jgi:hypothetical protein
MDAAGSKSAVILRKTAPLLRESRMMRTALPRNHAKPRKRRLFVSRCDRGRTLTAENAENAGSFRMVEPAEVNNRVKEIRSDWRERRTTKRA